MNDAPSNKPQIWQHKKTKKLYRTVGTCIDKEHDEFAVLYRAWDDIQDRIFISAQTSLYCRSWKNFKEKFEQYEYSELKVVPTTEQLMKDLKK